MRIGNIAPEDTAVKISIEDILSSKPEKNKEGRINSIKTKDGRTVVTSRVLATIVEKFIKTDSSYGTLTLDDGTGTIQVKFFRDAVSKMSSLEIGDLLDIIGSVREYEEELYLAPNIIIKTEDPNFELLRKAELLKKGKPSKEPEMPKVDLNAVVLMKVRELSDENGADFKTLIKNLKEYNEGDVIESLRILMLKGDLFEPKKGCIKVVD